MLFALIALQGCSSSSAEKDRLPGIEVKPDKTNTDFIIFEDPVGGSANTHKNNEFLAITVKNLVDSQIVFSPGYIKLFAKTEDGWVEIEDLMRQPEFEEQLPTTKEFPPGMIVTVIPWIPGMAKATPIRIFFEGQNVGTGEKVGAYMDFELNP
jgi:hypothetical protein